MCCVRWEKANPFFLSSGAPQETFTEKKLWCANAEFQALARDDLERVFASGPCHWLWRRLAKISRNYWEDRVTAMLVVTPQGGLHSCWTQPSSAAYGLTCYSTVANCRAVRLSSLDCWNVAAIGPRASVWRFWLYCKSTSLAAGQYNCMGVIQQHYCALYGLAWRSIGPAPRNATWSKLLGKTFPPRPPTPAQEFCWEAVLSTDVGFEMLQLYFQRRL